MMNVFKQKLLTLLFKKNTKLEESERDFYPPGKSHSDSPFFNSSDSDNSALSRLARELEADFAKNSSAVSGGNISDDSLNSIPLNRSTLDHNTLNQLTPSIQTNADAHPESQAQAHEPIVLPQGVEKFTLRVEGLDIVGLKAGDASKPTLVFLHGQYCDAHTWLAQLGSTELQAHYHMLAWSAPGYGKSEPWPHTNPSGLNFALMLKAWLLLQEKQNVILVGHGLGALIASSYSARFVSDVEALILVAPEMGVLRSGRYRRQTSYQDTNTLLTYGKEVFCKEKLKYLMVPRFDALDAESLRQLCITFHLPNETQFVSKLDDEAWQACSKTIINQLLMLDPEAFEVSSWTIMNEDLEEYRRYYHGYSEVWAAQFDRMVKQHDAKRLACRYHSAYQLFSGVGHFFHIEDAELFNQNLTQLIPNIEAFKQQQLNSKFNAI